MSCDLFLDYEDPNVKLIDFVPVLTRVGNGRWDVRYFPGGPLTRPLPPLPSFARLPANYERPPQVTVEDRASGQNIHIQGPVQGETRPGCMISYSTAPIRVQILRDVLLEMAVVEGSWITTCPVGGCYYVYGPRFVEQLRQQPDWYWGYDPNRSPGPPFVPGESYLDKSRNRYGGESNGSSQR